MGLAEVQVAALEPSAQTNPEIYWSKCMRVLKRSTVFVTLSLFLGSVNAGVEPYADLGKQGGVAMSCTNAEQILQISRSDNSTELSQIGPNGKIWQVQLPKFRDKHARFDLSADGDAAVVVTSIRDGEAFLVAGRGEKTFIDSGFVHEVDFQGNRALVVTGALVEGRESSSKRVRVYDIRSGDLLIDQIKTAEPEGVRTLERDWHFQLTADGRAFYQVRWWKDNSASITFVDIASRREFRYPLKVKDGRSLKLPIYDAVFPTSRFGLVAAMEGVFTLDESGFEALELPPELGGVERLRYSSKQRQAAVIGMEGWGVLDFPGKRITMVESPEAFNRDVRAADDAWIVVNGAGLRGFRVARGSPRLLRTVASGNESGVICANAYGVIRRKGKKFDWEPAALPQD